MNYYEYCTYIAENESPKFKTAQWYTNYLKARMHGQTGLRKGVWRDCEDCLDDFYTVSKENRY